MLEFRLCGRADLMRSDSSVSLPSQHMEPLERIEKRRGRVLTTIANYREPSFCRQNAIVFLLLARVANAQIAFKILFIYSITNDQNVFTVTQRSLSLSLLLTMMIFLFEIFHNIHRLCAGFGLHTARAHMSYFYCFFWCIALPHRVSSAMTILHTLSRYVFSYEGTWLRTYHTHSTVIHHRHTTISL